jgi:hypothetical protein
MLIEAAGSSAGCTARTILAARHARLMKRRGMGRAQVAVARTIVASGY